MVQVVEDFKFTYKGIVYTIPAGFTFDGFSNPRLLWRVLPSSYGPRVLGPGCKHDYFYRTHSISKEDADRLLEFEIHENGLNKTASRLALTGLWGKALELDTCEV
jgi:hypothetical protein